MALARWQRTIVDATGVPVAGASVRVEREITGTPLAVLYEDRDGTTLHSEGNPITTDANGDVGFYVSGGAFKITVTGTNFSKELRYEPIGLAQESDGLTAGLSYLFNTGTASGDPGSGYISFNNSTLGSVTELYVSGTNSYGVDVQSFLATISTGTIYIRTSDGSGFLVVSVTGAGTDQGDHYSFPVTVVDSGGLFLADANTGFLAVTDGVDGVSSGINYTFDSATDTASDPGTGDLRLNNATLSSVSEIAFDDNTSATGNPDISAFLATWDDSTATIKGTVTISKASQPQNYAIYNITAMTDATTHYRATVSHVSSSGSFSNTDDLIINFSRTGNDGADGSDGADGANGSDGADGLNPGLKFTFDTATDTATDPGTGDVRFNNGTLSSVSEIGIDDNSAETGNPDISAFVATWADSTNATIKGHLIIKKISAPENFAIFSISNVTDATTHNRISVSHIASSGSFSNTDEVSIEFTRTGNKGADGAGSGDVAGPGDGTVTDGQIAVFNGTTGQAIEGGLDPNGSPQDPITANTLLLKGGGFSETTSLLLAVDGDGKIRTTNNPRFGSIGIIVDGGGSAITTGVKAYLRVPFDCSIVGAYLMADQTGSAVVDIWVDAFANFPPTDADSITASAQPTISSGVSDSDETLTGWTVALSEGDVIGFNIDSASTIERLTIDLRIRKNSTAFTP